MILSIVEVVNTVPLPNAIIYPKVIKAMKLGFPHGIMKYLQEVIVDVISNSLINNNQLESPDSPGLFISLEPSVPDSPGSFVSLELSVLPEPTNSYKSVPHIVLEPIDDKQYKLFHITIIAIIFLLAITKIIIDSKTLTSKINNFVSKFVLVCNCNQITTAFIDKSVINNNQSNTPTSNNNQSKSHISIRSSFSRDIQSNTFTFKKNKQSKISYINLSDNSKSKLTNISLNLYTICILGLTSANNIGSQSSASTRKESIQQNTPAANNHYLNNEGSENDR
ncbi:hypothetical protein F8M41_003204 [Gigaspora margarita]|uniref:Uncharacterized protein n=1 Tax=Gigaspora margarita TaxID=4874 RepID=A0A8H4AY62_GIGMA|nr:hypothetical protein F8M41_003204 [Gigaspora margarita]